MNTLLLRILVILSLTNLVACSSEITSNSNHHLTDSCVTDRLLLTDLTQTHLQRNYFLSDMTSCPKSNYQ